MTRRTVDITVDAYDAPGLIAVARERERQRSLGHDDAMLIDGLPMPTVRLFNRARASVIGIVSADLFRELNEERESVVGVMLEEVAEAVDELVKLDRVGYRIGDAFAVAHSEDAFAEGVATLESSHPNAPYRMNFATLWDGIYPTMRWRSNPWVWVVRFKRQGGA